MQNINLLLSGLVHSIHRASLTSSLGVKPWEGLVIRLQVLFPDYVARTSGQLAFQHPALVFGGPVALTGKSGFFFNVLFSLFFFTLLKSSRTCVQQVCDTGQNPFQASQTFPLKLLLTIQFDLVFMKHLLCARNFAGCWQSRRRSTWNSSDLCVLTTDLLLNLSVF